MDKLDKLSADIKGLNDFMAQIQRSIADVRHEYTSMRKQLESTERLTKEVAALQEKLAKIAAFMGSNG